MFVLHVIDSLVPGGAERSLVGMVPHLLDAGVDVEVALLHDRRGLQDEVTDLGVAVHSLAGRGGRAGWIARTRTLLRDRRPDLVHTTLFESDVVGRVAATLDRRPVVSSLVSEKYGDAHVGNPDLRRSRVRAAWALDAATARATRRLHAVSVHVADTMAARLHYSRDRVDVVPRGRDPAVLGVRTPERRRACRERLGVDSREQVILAVARQEHAKGLDVLVRALPGVLARAPTSRLFVAGRDARSTTELRRLVGELSLGDAVVFLGERDDVPDLMCAADVFALPSRREGFPGSVIEAMALELPVVASDLPQIQEVTGPDLGTFVPVGSAELLAEAIVRQLADPDGARAAGRRARQRFLDRFTAAAVARHMVAFYERSVSPG